jgi:hypothetical protein
VPPEVTATYRKNMLALWNASGGVDKEGNKTVGLFKFRPEADVLMQELEAWLEPQLGQGGALEAIADWASKLAGATARVAGILHVATGIAAGTSILAVIPAATTAAAIRLAKEYLVPHALAAFGLMTEDHQIDEARRVLAWLARTPNYVDFVNGSWVVRQRAIHVHLLGSRYSAEEVAAIVRVLVSHGFLRRIAPEPRKGPGRPPGPEYEIHPDLFEKRNTQIRSQYLQNSALGGGQANSVDIVNAPGSSTFSNEVSGESTSEKGQVNSVEIVNKFSPPQLSSETPGDSQNAENGSQNLQNSVPDKNVANENEHPHDSELFE